MALVTANDVAIVSGRVTMPIAGIWIADIVVDQPSGTGFSEGTAVTIKSGDFELKGTVTPNRTGEHLDAVHVRVLGGKGGMSKAATPKSYTQPGAFVRDVIDGLADDGGETISDETDSEFLATNLAAWAVLEGSVSTALGVLLGILEPTWNWRFLPNGELWMGPETWQTVTVQYEPLSMNLREASAELGVEAPSIVPGVTVDGLGKVNRVEHNFTSNSVRSRVWVEGPQADRGFKGAVAPLVYQATAPIDYFTLYDAKVVSQSADLATLDLQPQDSRLPGMSKVPIRYGLPGITAQISAGAYIRLGWNRGDPRLPYAALWDGGETVTKLVVKAATVYLGDEPGAAALVTVTEFNSHTHSFTGTGTVNAPTAPAVGTTKVRAV